MSNIKCEDCPYHYELTKEQKEAMFTDEYDGSCGCKALETYGRCPYAENEEEE